MKDFINIGFQGVAGAYSQAAVHQFAKKKNWTLDQIKEAGYDDFPTLTKDLLQGKLDYVVMPVENSTTGLITRSLDLFRDQQIMALEEMFQEVQHTLWGLPGSKISDLKEVFSHPEALSQCEDFFKNHPSIEGIAYSDTAKAAYYIKERGDLSVGAIASPQAGEIYGLVPLLARMQTEESNTTRFFVASRIDETDQEMGLSLAHRYKKYPERTLMMLFVQLPHRPGALAKLLNLFHVFDCNLVALDSRPIVNQPFKYGFFIEVDLGTTQLNLEILWESLLYVCDTIQIVAHLAPVENPILKEVSHVSN